MVLFRGRTVLPCVLLPVLIFTAMDGLHISGVSPVPSDIQSMLKHEFQTGHIGSTYTEEYMPWWVTEDPPAIARAAGGVQTASVLPGAQLQFRYRSSRYDITLENPGGAGSGVLAIVVDGVALAFVAAGITLLDDSTVHHVQVRMGH